MTVLLSSHILAETEALCQRVTIIRAGKTVESGTLESMRHLSRTSIKAELLGDPGDLSRIKGVEDISMEGNILHAQVDADSLGELIRVLGDTGVRSLVSQPPTLEELFLRHYKVDGSQPAPTRGGGIGMSTAVAGPRHARPEPVRTESAFTGTFGLLRLYLRRDRIVLPLWVLLLSLPLASVYIGSIETVYPTAAQRAAFAASIMASPAQRALYGNVYNDSVGAVGIWKAGVFHALIAVAVILTVIRHTRAEEETGRAELLDSTAVGRYASLTAALILAFGASIATGLIGTAGLLTTDVPPAGSLAFGLALAGSGLVFSAVAAVAAQLSTGARTARGIAFGALGVAFALRAVGDASTGTLSWFSPLGWSLQVRPYAGERWWVLLLHLATTVVLTLIAYQLLRRRDIGGGLISDRPGAPAASATLSGTFGLAWRLQRGVAAGVDDRVVAVCPAHRQCGGQHRRRHRRQRHHPRHRQPVGRIGRARRCVHHHLVQLPGGRGCRDGHLVDTAAVPGGEHPAGRNRAGWFCRPDPLGRKSYRLRHRRHGGGDSGRGCGGGAYLRHRQRRRRRQTARSVGGRCVAAARHLDAVRDHHCVVRAGPAVHPRRLGCPRRASSRCICSGRSPGCRTG